MLLMDVVVDFNKVRVAGVEVPKPSSVGASDWLDFWEAISHHDPHASETLREELDTARREISNLESEIDRLNVKIMALEESRSIKE